MNAACPACVTAIDPADRFCRWCGVALRPDAELTEAGRAVAVPPTDVRPAVRPDLAPLVPTAVRALTVLAAAGALEWAVRRGTRRLLHNGLPLMNGARERRAPRRTPKSGNGTTRIDSVVIERRISIRH